MPGYRDPDIETDPDALDRPDNSSGYCFGRVLLVVLALLILLFVIFYIGWVRSG